MLKKRNLGVRLQVKELFIWLLPHNTKHSFPLILADEKKGNTDVGDFFKETMMFILVATN